MNSLWDDLLACEQKEALINPPKRERPIQHDGTSFTDGGYLVRTLRQTCASCGGRQETVEGLFHVELKANGTRRLTALKRGAQWPLNNSLPMEVNDQEIDWCADCFRELGFNCEVQRPAGYTLVVQSASLHTEVAPC